MTFMNSQHEDTNSKGFKTLVLEISDKQIRPRFGPHNIKYLTLDKYILNLTNPI